LEMWGGGVWPLKNAKRLNVDLRGGGPQPHLFTNEGIPIRPPEKTPKARAREKTHGGNDRGANLRSPPAGPHSAARERPTFFCFARMRIGPSGRRGTCCFRTKKKPTPWGPGEEIGHRVVKTHANRIAGRRRVGFSMYKLKGPQDGAAVDSGPGHEERFEPGRRQSCDSGQRGQEFAGAFLGERI